jgi:hypothetical protein
MGWFKGKKDKGDDRASPELPPPQKSSEPEVAEPTASAASKSKLVHATSVNGFASMQSPQAIVNRKSEVTDAVVYVLAVLNITDGHTNGPGRKC